MHAPRKESLVSLTCKFLKRWEPHNELRNLLRAHFGVRCVIPAFAAASAMDSLPVVGAMPTSDPLATWERADTRVSKSRVSEIYIKFLFRGKSIFESIANKHFLSRKPDSGGQK